MNPDQHASTGTVDALFFLMSVMTETYQDSAADHVLRTFARHAATTLSTSLLFEEARPFATADIARALARLEQRDHALLRYTWEGNDWVTLTLHGVAWRDGAPAATPPVERRQRRTTIAPQIVYEHAHGIRDGAHGYSVYVLGAERGDGTWAGWIEFVPADGTHRLRTAQETSQPNRDALAYWASGLEDVYLDGALARATR
jgi:hypothetical protein